MPRIQGFDGIRAVSVIMVVISHSGAWIGWETSPLFHLVKGSVGVSMFFVLSGFLITSLLCAEADRNGAISLKNFYIRRSLRIFPVLYLNLFFIFLASTFIYSIARPEGFVFAGLYVYNFVPISYYDGALGHTWSLAVEEHFYFFWPFLVSLLYVKYPRRLLLIALMWSLSGYPILLILKSASFAQLYFIDRWTFVVSSRIALGCVLALVMRSDRPIPRRLCKFMGTEWSIALGFLLYANSVTLRFLPTDMIDFVQALGLALVLAWVIERQSSAAVRILEWKPFVFLGTVSYGIYAYQGLFIGNGPFRAADQSFPPPVWLGIILTMVAAPISYYWFEKPIMNLRNKRGWNGRSIKPHVTT